MKLQRTTLILLVIALGLGGFVYFSEPQHAQNQEAKNTTQAPIFTFKEDQIQSFTIYRDEEELNFERVSQPIAGWRMKLPKDTLASTASVSFLVNLLAHGKSDRSFTVAVNRLAEFGLDKPSATIHVKVNGQKMQRLVLGKPNFNNSFLYAQVNPSSETSQEPEILLVPFDFKYAVERPLSEWQQPQEENTPTSSEPSPTQERSPTSSTENKGEPSPDEDDAQPSSPKKNSGPSAGDNRSTPSPQDNSTPSVREDNASPSPSKKPTEEN